MIDRLLPILSGQQYRPATEADLRDSLAVVLTEAGVRFDREYPMGETGRPDFFVDGVVIEVKARGGRSDLVRQVMRYAEHPMVTGILVVTTRAQHQLPDTMRGKPARLLTIARGLL
jgi:hypothetical protein